MVAPSYSREETMKEVFAATQSPNTALMVAPTLDGALAPSPFNNTLSGTGWDQANQNGHYGGRFVFASALDLTDREWVIFQIAHQIYSYGTYLESFANGAVRIYFEDSAGNWSGFTITGLDYMHGSGSDETVFGSFASYKSIGRSSQSHSICINTAATPQASSGTLDWSDVVALETHSRTTQARSKDLYIGLMQTHDRPIMTNGEVVNPCTLVGMYQTWVVRDSGWDDWDRFFGPGTTEAKTGTQRSIFVGLDVGDGATATRFEMDTEAMSFVPTSAALQEYGSNWAGWYHGVHDTGVTASKRALFINQSASCVTQISNSIVGGVPYNNGDWRLEIAGSPSGTCDWSGTSILNAAELILRHGNFTACTFGGNYRVQVNTDTVMTGCALGDTPATGDGIYVASAPADYSAIECNVLASNSGDDITINPSAGAGNFNFSGVTTEAGHTLAIRNESASIAITVEVAAGITYSTSTAGGTVTVTQPAVSVTVTGLVAGSEVRAYVGAVDSWVEIGGIDSTVGTTFQFAHTEAGNAGSITILRAGYEWKRIPITYGSVNVEVDGTQTPDPNYSNP